jgi:hypothetical protein
MPRRSNVIATTLGVVLAACWLLVPLAVRTSGGEARPTASAGAKPSPTPAIAKTKADANPQQQPAPRPEPADNSYCYVCHANYEHEKLTKAHQPVGVGCEKCHGMSVKHSGDEDGLTPPDKMYAKSAVDPFCMTCHEKSKLVKRDDHKDYFRDLQEGETCSDCHAEKHHLAVRTRIWDKKTGKLVKDDGVRMMLKDSPATEGAAAKSKHGSAGEQSKGK